MTMPTTVPTSAPINASTTASPPGAASVSARSATAPTPLPLDSAQPFIFRRLITPELIDASGLLSERGCITLCESARIELQAQIGWFSHKFLAQSQLNVVLARLSAARAIGAEATVDATAAANTAGAKVNAPPQGEIVGAAAPRLFEYVWLVVWISKLSMGSIALTHEIYGVSGALYYRQRIMEGCFNVALQQVAPLTAEMLACGAQAQLPRGWSMSSDLLARCKDSTPAETSASALTLLLAPQALPVTSAPVVLPAALQIALQAADAAFIYQARINYSQTQCRHSQLYEANLPLLCEQAWCYYLSALGLLPQPGTPCPWRVTELAGTIHQLPRISQVVTIALAPPVLPVAPLKPRQAAAAVALSWQLWCEDGSLSYEQHAQLELSAPLLAALSAVRSRAGES